MADSSLLELGGWIGASLAALGTLAAGIQAGYRRRREQAPAPTLEGLAAQGQEHGRRIAAIEDEALPHRVRDLEHDTRAILRDLGRMPPSSPPPPAEEPLPSRRRP